MFLKRFLFILIVIGTVFTQQVEAKDKNINPADALKMKQADHYFFAYDYRRALNIYRELAKKYRNNALLNYKIGKCHLEIGTYELAVEYFQNARNIDSLIRKELYFEYARSLHHHGQLDKAIDAFNHFKVILKNKAKKIAKYDVDRYIAQCETAKKLKANPVDVKLLNLGRNVNSRHGDYGPSISADGKTLIFTSRRADTEGAGIDVNGDHKFFEDIYITEFNAEAKDWEEAENIPGKLNSVGHDAALCISPDGKFIYIYRNDGQIYIGDIFVSKVSSTGKWGTPKPLDKPVNSTYFESSASISADNNKLFFVSERPKQKKSKSQGQSDIWVADRLSKSTWGEPRNLGPIINTEFDEGKVYLHPDGKTIFFSSTGHNTMGGYDIFVSYLQENGEWSKPMNMGYPINTVRDDAHFVLSLDKKTAYFSTDREDGFGESDIYKIDMSNYPWDKVIKDIPTGIAKGLVKGSSGPVSDARVTYVNATTGIQVGATSTREDGTYFITLPKGQYTVKVAYEGYQNITEGFEMKISEGGNSEVVKDFQLTPEKK